MTTYSRFVIDRFTKFMILKAASIDDENTQLRIYIDRYQDDLIRMQNENNALFKEVLTLQERVQKLNADIVRLESDELSYMLETCSTETDEGVYKSEKRKCNCIIL